MNIDKQSSRDNRAKRILFFQKKSEPPNFCHDPVPLILVFWSITASQIHQ